MDGENMHMEEYWKAMTALRCVDWPLVRKHLCKPEGDLVLAALKTYVAAFEAFEDAQDTFDKYVFDCTAPLEEVREHMDEMIRLNKVYLSARDTQDVAHRALMLQVLGQEVFRTTFGR